MLTKLDQEIQSLKTMKLTQLSEEEKDKNFLIRTEIDILFILRGIMQKNTLIALYFGSEDNFILTSILAIDTDKKKIIVDYGTDEQLNQLVLQAKKLTFVTSQNRVKIEFSCENINKAKFENRDAIVVNLPESLIRMQRRNYFRVSTPTTRPLKCIIPIPSNGKTAKAEITLLDISCGGIGVIDHHPVISFDPGIIFKNCQITLPKIGTVSTTIQAMNTYEITLKNGLSCKRAGCQFIDLPASMEAMIQRYIVKQEQIRKTK